jgi:hypothetical protein
MIVVQTRLPELEYDLLRKKARAERRPIHEVVREAIRLYVFSDEVDPNHPIFRALARPAGRKGTDRTSLRVDELLYGSGP